MIGAEIGAGEAMAYVSNHFVAVSITWEKSQVKMMVLRGDIPDFR